MNWARRRKRRARRRRAGYALAALAGVLGGLAAAGLLLPAEHERVDHALLARPPETVWRVMRLAAADPPHRLMIERTVDGRPGLPVRTVELVATARGTLVTVTQRSRVRDPLARVMVRLDRRRGDLGRLLRDLDRRVGSDARQAATGGGGAPLP